MATRGQIQGNRNHNNTKHARPGRAGKNKHRDHKNYLI